MQRYVYNQDRPNVAPVAISEDLTWVQVEDKYPAELDWQVLKEDDDQW
ncbi:hypothetical protein [uncultured Thiohalocapsa sp.]|nr:hypothetical protein [uncultured Thiohalocapsa sp.]